MLESRLEAWLRFSLILGLGARSQLQLLRALGEPAVIFATPRVVLAELLPPKQVDLVVATSQLSDYPELKLTELWLAEPNHYLLTLDSPQYPVQLLDLPDPPILLYCLGDLNLLARPALSIVGSRSATPQGLANAEAFSQHLSDGGVCIVSGLASGIDAAAHRGGLAGQGSSIAVVGTGLDRVYPASNRDLAHRIAADGLILSEFALGSPPIAKHFPQRNRIIAALGLGCLVVEAALGSGSLITARQAVDIGREIFAIPGSIHSPVAKGCHSLIKNGAKLVESAEDIFNELCFIKDYISTRIETSVSSESSDLETQILNVLGWDPVDMDTLCLRTDLTNAALCEILLGLELEGKLASLPGGRYQRIGGGV